MSEHDPAPRQSKFEWRPEDVEILSDEDAALARAQYEEWLIDRDTGDEEPTSTS